MPTDYLRIGGQTLQQSIDIDRAELFLLLKATQIVERGVDHRGHRVEISGDLVAQRFIVDELGAQAQAGERRAQVM